MPIFLAILLQLLPTLLSWRAFAHRLKFSNCLLSFCLCWFIGQYLSAIAIYLICWLLVPFTNLILSKACLLYGSVIACTGFLLLKDGIGVKPRFTRFDYLLTFFALGLSYVLYTSQLALQDGQIKVGPAYWDFGYQSQLIQSFVYSDNFPHSLPSNAGVPLAYHFGYFFGLPQAF